MTFCSILFSLDQPAGYDKVPETAGSCVNDRRKDLQPNLDMGYDPTQSQVVLMSFCIKNSVYTPVLRVKTHNTILHTGITYVVKYCIKTCSNISCQVAFIMQHLIFWFLGQLPEPLLPTLFGCWLSCSFTLSSYIAFRRANADAVIWYCRKSKTCLSDGQQLETQACYLHILWWPGRLKLHLIHDEW